MPLAPEMDCPGLLGGSLKDLRLGWEVVADRTRRRRPLPVVGRSATDAGDDARSRSARPSARGRTLPGHRGRVRDIDSSALDDAHRVWNRLAWPPFAERYAGLVDDPSLGAGTASLIAWGSAHRDELPDARARADEIRAGFAEAFRV